MAALINQRKQRPRVTTQICKAIQVARQLIATSLRVKLLLAFLAVALAPSGLIAIRNYKSMRAALTDAANQSLFAAASQTSVRLDAFIGSNLSVIGTEARLPVLGDYLVNTTHVDEKTRGGASVLVLEALRAFAQKDAVFISSYALLDRNGHNVLDTLASNVGLDESDRDYFRVARETGLPYVSPIEFSPVDGMPYLYFSSMVSTAAGKPVGVLRGRYNAAILQQMIVENTGLVGSQSFAILLNEDRLLLAHGLMAPSSAPSRNFRLAMPLELDRILELQADQRLPRRPPDDLLASLPGMDEGLARLGSSAPYFDMLPSAATGGHGVQAAAVTRMKTQPWIVAFLQPQDVFLAPTRAQTRSTLLWALVTIAVVAAATAGMAQLLTGPVVRLTSVAQQVAEGAMNAKAGVESKDEIGILATTFNFMTDKLTQTLRGLRESEEKFRGIFENALEGIFQISFGGQVLNANPAMARILAYDSPEEMTANLTDVRQQLYLRAEDRDTFLSAIMERGALMGNEFQVCRKDGQVIWISTCARVVRDDAGQPLFIEGFATDITERKRAGEELERHRHHLAELVREHRRADRCQGPGRGGKSGEERVFGQHEPRAAHAPQCDSGL